MNEADEPINAERQVDASGTLCPVPVLRASRELATMVQGQVLEVLATDPLAAMDLAVMCERTGHELVRTRTEGDRLRVWIRVSRARRSDAG